MWPTSISLTQSDSYWRLNEVHLGNMTDKTFAFCLLPCPLRNAVYAQEPVTAERIENLLVEGMERGIRGDYRGAITFFSRVIQLDPQEVEAYYNRGIAYKRLNQWQRAMADFNQTLMLNPNYAEAYVERSDIYVSLGQREKAIADLKTAIQLLDSQPHPSAVQWVRSKLELLQN